MDNIYESIVSTIDQDYQSKKDMNLSSFTRKDLSKSIIDKYKSDYRQLSHIRVNNNTKGYVWLDGDSLVGFINVEDKDGEKWINSFEIFGKYKKHGLSKQMMDVAMRDLNATHLSVNKKNNVAIKIYKSIGFNTYKETDTMLFMSINESYIEESVKIRNQMGKTEIEDIKTVISSLDDNSFNDFKFKDIVYCDIKYKSKKPIAFITIRTKLVNNSTVGYVSLAVDPKYQNQGIGKSLTEKAVSWFKKERGIHFLEWHCLQDNEASKKLANYAGFREYIAKGQEEYIHFTMESSNNESYIEESSYPKEIPDEIIDLLKRLNSYDYGYVKNGKKIKGMKNFFEDYKSLTISEFEKYEIGVCWDYVHYEAYWFSKHGYKYETFYIQVQDEDNDCPSHAYLVFYLPKSSKVYYFESSWGKYQGIEEFDNINELHKTIKDRHISSAISKCDPKTYFRNKYDAKSSSWEHLRCGEYMVKVSKGRIQLNESYIEEAFGNNSAKNIIKKYKKDRIVVDRKNIYKTIKDPIQKIITSYCKSVPSFKIENIDIESGLNFTWECKYDQKEIDKITRSLISLKIGQVFKDVESQRPYKLSIFNGNIIKIDPGLYTIDDVSGNSYSGTITIEVLYTSYESSINKIDVKTLADVTSKMNIKSDFYINSTKGFVNINTSAVTKEDISVPSNVDIVKKDSAYFGTSIYLISKSVENVNESYAIDIKESDIDTKSIVFFTKNITPESLLKLYQFMTNPSHGVNPLHGNIGVKISTGEYGSHNFLSPLLIKDLVNYLHGVIIECNTAYVGKRNTTEDHWNTIKAHGFLNIANCDIMDEDGDIPLPVKDPYHIKNNYVGDHLKRYDSILMLSHFKGHAMAGYGGALKNMSIGMASSKGKLHIHTAGEGGDMMKADRDKFLESMVDADMSVMDYMGKENILYINVANNLSIDCDCDANPKDPDISDIGIFASTDPVALDQACIDAVYNHPEEKKRNIINRITSRNGTHTIDCAYEKGLGNKHYVILDIDQVVEESYIEEEIENEFSPTSFVKRSSLPAKNQKNHTRYLRKKAHSNKTNNATAQNELPKYNQIGELYVEEVAKSVQVKPIFIVTSYTNTPFGKAIKTFTHSEYTHAAISFDTSLEKLYSFNADSKYSSNGYKGGISRESLSSYVDSYEKTIIQVNCIFLKPSDFDIIQKTLDNLLENEEKTKYAYSNIINILIGRAKDTGMAMVCSQFVSYILHTADIKLLDKPDNTVTPKDLSTITNPRVYKIFEGYAKDYEKKRIDRIFRKLKTKALLIKESLLKLCV